MTAPGHAGTTVPTSQMPRYPSPRTGNPAAV